MMHTERTSSSMSVDTVYTWKLLPSSHDEGYVNGILFPGSGKPRGTHLH